MTAEEFKSTILPAYGAMAATARKILGDDEIAKDAVQDVMRALWEGRERLNAVANGAAYAIRAVRNRCLDIHRQNAGTVMTAVDDVAETIAVEENDDLRRLELLSSAIEQLGEPRRTILRLSLSGKSGIEIARAVYMNEGTVRQHLSRSRKELRKLIIQYENI